MTQFPFDIGQRVICVEPESESYHRVGRVENITSFSTGEFCWVKWEDGSREQFWTSEHSPLQRHP